MSTTVSYKGNTIATVDNTTKTLTTEGKYLEADIILTDVTGGGSPTLQTKTKSYAPTESSQSETITADVGYDGLDEVNVSVGAISSTYVGTGIMRRASSDMTVSGSTVTAPSGYYASNASTAVASGSATTPATTITANPSVSIDSDGLITATVSKTQSVTPTVSAGYVSSGTAGTISVSGSGTSQLTKRTSSDLTASGATVTAPAGYYPASASKAVASGTEGTPTATKGTVSNHAVSVTPSVTNSAGYISGGTKTGTAVSVTASELVSGAKSITSNGNGQDVTNYATVDVAVPNTYAAGDDGKVVSNGALVSQTSATYTSNNTYDTTLINSVIVNVSGGSSNYVTGTFTPTTAQKNTAISITIPYTGNGYPVAAMIFPVGGPYNSSTGNTWYSLVQQYAVGFWSMTKSRAGAPSYTTTGAQNYGTVAVVYKSSSSNSTSYSRTSGMNVNEYSSSSATTTSTQVARFNSKSSMSVFVANTSYGFAAGIEYEYHVLYSS